MRYSHKENSNHIRYVVIISSKNISTSNLLDVYSIAYGDVNDKDFSKEGENNGEKIAGFLADIYEKAGLNVCPLGDELKKVKFIIGDINDKQCISFYKPEEVWAEIKEKTNLTIISPFLSENVISVLKDKINCLVSTEQGFIKLEEETIKGLIECGKVKLCTESLHAKIYNWKEDGKTKYIVGSSNATINGCNICNESKNVEYNIGFEGKEDEDILEGIKSKIRGFNINDYKIWKAQAGAEGVDFRKYYIEFLEQLKVTCEKTETQYKITLECSNISNNTLKDYPSYKVQCAVDGDFKGFDNKELVLTYPKAVSTIRVKVINNNADIDAEEEEEERIFCYSIYKYWKEDLIKEELDQQCNISYIKLLEYIQRQIVEGKKIRNISFRKTESGEGGKKKFRRYSMDKIYVHEDLMKLMQVTNQKKDYVSGLKELKKLAESILKVDEKDVKQNQMKESIGKMLEVEREG